MLADGTGVHPSKPLDDFSMIGVTGTCAKGIALANVKNAEIRDIAVAGLNGPLIGIYNVTGKGLEGAPAITAPKVPDAVPVPAKAFVPAVG